MNPTRLFIGTAVLAIRLNAAVYQVGQVVENFSLVDRGTGKTVQLKDFSGKIVVLDWFAWWCPYCQAAAPQLLEGIDQWYTQRGGNPAGIPVIHVGINLQPGQEPQTQNFVDRAGLSVVLQDFDRAVANRIATGGQPLFAIINGVTNSPSHQPWQLLYSRQGYGQTSFPLPDFRASIDAVKAPPVAATAPGVDDPRIEPDGSFSIRVAGDAGATYRLESSGSPGNWTTTRTFQLRDPVERIAVAADTAISARFFRVVLP